MTFSVPYDAYNSQVLFWSSQYYKSVRTTDVGYNTKANFDQYKIRTQNISNTTTLSEIQGWIDSAAQNKSWLVLVYHQVDNNGGEYSVTPQMFDSQLAAIKNSGIKTATISQALNILLPQVSN